MSNLKFVVWNMEWLNDLFDPNGNFYPDDHKPHHSSTGTTVKNRRDDLKGVIEEISPDVIVVVEGPNKQSELKLFFDTDVTGSWSVALQPTKGSSQCIGCAVRTDTGKFDNAAPLKWIDTTGIKEFEPFELKNEENEIIEKYKFERLPFYAEVKTKEGNVFRLLGLHLKSKGIFSAFEWSKWWAVSDANRKKILAAASQIRLNFLNVFLTADDTKNIPLIVCGDINDGPGMDASEKRLFGSGIERLIGNVWQPRLTFGNALFDTLEENDRRELNFENISTTSFKDPIFNNVWHRDWIDHILYSCNKENWVTNGAVHEKMSDEQFIWKKYKHASDHFPISATLTI